ncbi:MAG: iron-containing alcohol dehydrogenase [Dehalococcoidia bacterium]|jgi:alcohol dehydrogenase class IV
MLPVKSFSVPPIVYGSGAADHIGSELNKLSIKKGLIVTDKVMTGLPVFDSIIKALETSDIRYSVYDGVATEPTCDYVDEGLKACRESDAEFILAVGGGSPIDTSKAISIMMTNPGSIEDYMGAGKVAKDGIPLVAMPTTAGTGSEVTPYTIITDEKTSVKMLISSPKVMPRLAIVDPMLTLSCPPALTAAVGIDALTHAIEAYVSVKAQPMTDMYCLSAIVLLYQYLKPAWEDGDNVEARERTMLGSLYAGIAFSNSSVALVHGMSRPIGAYFHVAHGASNAALLKEVMEFSYPGNPARYAYMASLMGQNIEGKDEMEASAMAVEAVGWLVKDIKIATLPELGVTREKLEEMAPRMAEDAIASGSPANNPRPASKEEIIDLYMKAYNA